MYRFVTTKPGYSSHLFPLIGPVIAQSSENWLKVFKMDLRQLRQPRLNLASDFSTDSLFKFKISATGKESNTAQITLIVEMRDTHIHTHTHACLHHHTRDHSDPPLHHMITQVWTGLRGQTQARELRRNVCEWHIKCNFTPVSTS